MTEADLMEIEDVTPRFVPELRVIEWRKVTVPVMVGHRGALWQEPDDPIVTLPNGERWMIGRIGERRVRTRMP